MTLVVQAAVLDSLLFDAPPFSQDGFTTTEVDISRGQVADAFVVAMAVVVADEGSDRGFKVCGVYVPLDFGLRASAM